MTANPGALEEGRFVADVALPEERDVSDMPLIEFPTRLSMHHWAEMVQAARESHRRRKGGR